MDAGFILCEKHGLLAVVTKLRDEQEQTEIFKAPLVRYYFDIHWQWLSTWLP